MTRAEWEECQDVSAMLQHVRGKVSERKLRLFAAACARSVWGLLPPEGRRAVEAVEGFADGTTTAEELAAAREAAWLGVRDAWSNPERDATCAAACAASRLHHYAGWYSRDPPREAATAAARAAGRKEPVQVCALARDVFTPFGAPAVARAWLSWRGGLVVALARQAYDARDYAALGVLADALDDAGCNDAALLAHCRSPGPHARGCHILDLLLGKQ